MPDVRSKLLSVEPGCEWIVDAHGCDPSALASLETMNALFDLLIADLRRHIAFLEKLPAPLPGREGAEGFHH